MSSTTSTPETATTTSLADGDEVEVVPTESQESTTTTIPEDADLSVLPEPPAGGWETVPIVFPVAGPVKFYDDWSCPRRYGLSARACRYRRHRRGGSAPSGG